MPIPRSLPRAQVWQTSGYVCPSCRHGLSTGRLEIIRRQSNVSPVEKDVEVEVGADNASGTTPEGKSNGAPTRSRKSRRRPINVSQIVEQNRRADGSQKLSDSLVDTLKKRVEEYTQRMIKELQEENRKDSNVIENVGSKEAKDDGSEAKTGVAPTSNSKKARRRRAQRQSLRDQRRLADGAPPPLDRLAADIVGKVKNQRQVSASTDHAGESATTERSVEVEKNTEHYSKQQDTQDESEKGAESELANQVASEGASQGLASSHERGTSIREAMSQSKTERVGKAADAKASATKPRPGRFSRSRAARASKKRSGLPTPRTLVSMFRIREIGPDGKKRVRVAVRKLASPEPAVTADAKVSAPQGLVSAAKQETETQAGDTPKQSPVGMRRRTRARKLALASNSTPGEHAYADRVLRKHESMGEVFRKHELTEAVFANQAHDQLFRKHNSRQGDAYTEKVTQPATHDVNDVATTQSSVRGEAESQTFAGNIDYDGEHKSLVEVMGIREAMAQKRVKAPAAAKLADAPLEKKGGGPLLTNLPTVGPVDVVSIYPSGLEVTPVDIPQPQVPSLEYGLDRVLFNPGVYQLQDPLSRVYNFDPYLQKIMPVAEFDFNALKEYKTSSQDAMLSSLAKEHGKRYIGSTSSMTGTLGHFHYLLSDWRRINLSMFSRGFTDKVESFTQINRAPNSIFLRWKNGTYAIDADKEYDSANVLMMLGKSMEKLLTLPQSDYERYRKTDPRSVSDEERSAPEAYQFTTMGDFLMRSQLDAHDPRLPGTGNFDLKTRAVLSVRMDAEDFKPMTGYEIYTLQGRFGSYEREYYDMIRSTMLKYMLQARMGRMDGIFVAFHNVERIFGFQYIPIQEMDRALHGQVHPCLGDQEFKTSLALLNKVLDKATAKFPEQSLRLHFETASESMEAGSATTVMWIFAEPMAEAEIDRIQSSSKNKIAEFERTMVGMEKEVESTESKPASLEPEQAAVAEDETSAASSEYATSSSSVDLNFINTASPSDSSSQERKPLFAASIIIKSRVRGEIVERPEKLKPEDTWEVEYLLREWDAPEAMWARYESMKARRKEKLRDEEETEAGGENGELSSKQKREDQFITFLRSMSTSGREFRSKMDESEAGTTPVVLGQPPSPGFGEIEDVDEYMRWLYAGKKA